MSVLVLNAGNSIIKAIENIWEVFCGNPFSAIPDTEYKNIIRLIHFRKYVLKSEDVAISRS